MKRNQSLLVYTRDNDTQVSELGPSCLCIQTEKPEQTM